MPKSITSLFLRFFRPSAREFFLQADQVQGYTWRDRLHGYIYGRWPYLYIGLGTGQHPLARAYRSFRGFIGLPLPESLQQTNSPRPTHASDIPSGTFADGYHGKVMPLNSARRLLTVNEPVNLPDLEQVIPYTRARDLILKNPDHIVALECPCRSGRDHPCLPLDVCLIVGEPFASFVYEHQPKRSRWITSQQAVEVLEAEEARGHVHHAFFKDAMLGRFYAICNCCACCCGALQTHHNGTPMLASSGFLCQVDEDQCLACGNCAEVCQFFAISVEQTAQVDASVCMGCGVCASHCPSEALSLHPAPERGVPLETMQLMDAVR